MKQPILEAVPAEPVEALPAQPGQIGSLVGCIVKTVDGGADVESHAAISTVTECLAGLAGLERRLVHSFHLL